MKRFISSKSVVAAILLLAAVFTLFGCSKKTDNSKSFPLCTGVWNAQSEGTADEGLNFSVFTFNADGQSGSMLDVELGIGCVFDIEMNDNGIIFHMGSAEDSTPVSVDAVDEKNAKLTINGSTYSMKLVSADPNAKWYSNADLEEAARAYYAAANGNAPEYAASVTNDDGSATVQLYDLVDGHNSTAAWYTFDRFTGTGSDINSGEQIDITAYAAN